jgi:hypothetical protein
MIGLPELFALLAAAGSATFGVLALLTEFRDDRGRVGRRARLVIAGIVLSAALGILATRASDLARQDQAARRQENVLAAVWAENSRVEPGMVTALVTFTFQLEHLPRPRRGSGQTAGRRGGARSWPGTAPRRS